MLSSLAQYLVDQWEALASFTKSAVVTLLGQPIIDAIHTGYDSVAFYLSSCTSAVLEALHSLFH
jgi:hypothetical protein